MVCVLNRVTHLSAVKKNQDFVDQCTVCLLNAGPPDSSIRTSPTGHSDSTGWIAGLFTQRVTDRGAGIECRFLLLVHLPAGPLLTI
jgi:hypothetical protein